MTKEDVKLIASIAWKGAANAHRMYPDNKHTFAEYWDGAESQFSDFCEEDSGMSENPNTPFETGPAMKDKELEKALRTLFDAGAKCNAQHPDDDSYDEVHFQRAIKKIKPAIRKVWSDACHAQMGAVLEHAVLNPSTNGAAIKHWVKMVPYDVAKAPKLTK